MARISRCLRASELLESRVRFLIWPQALKPGISMITEKACYAILPSNDSTLAVELYRTGLARRKKHLVFFEDFRGKFISSGNDAEGSQMQIAINASSAVCRDAWLSAKKQEELSRFARDNVLATGQHPEIKFESSSVARKRIRGFVVKGTLNIRGTARDATVNVVINQTKPDTLQLDGDATLRLSEFGIEPPSWFLGLTKIKDEVLIRVLLWATRSA